jgi:DNA-binding NtrC family response regulator
MAALATYAWPGNIRELENVIERLMVTVHEKIITLDHLPKEMVASFGEEEQNHTLKANGKRFSMSGEQEAVIDEWLKDQKSLKEIIDATLSPIEKYAIVKILGETSDNRAEAARRLGISRPALYQKLKEYGID